MDHKKQEKVPLLGADRSANLVNESHMDRIGHSESTPHDVKVGSEDAKADKIDRTSFLGVNHTESREKRRASKEKSGKEHGPSNYKDMEESEGSPKMEVNPHDVPHSLNASYSTPSLDAIGGDSPKKHPRKDHHIDHLWIGQNRSHLRFFRFMVVIQR